MKTKKAKPKKKREYNSLSKLREGVELKKPRSFSMTDTEYMSILKSAKLNGDLTPSKMYVLLVNDKDFRTKKFISK